ncbi:IS3 family transposase [Salmonella enterica subsp. enterica]|nr:IS3 family transposase [Salmonella enterica subsp. enterica]
MFFRDFKIRKFYTSKFKDIDGLKMAIEDYIRYYGTRQLALNLTDSARLNTLKSYRAEVTRSGTERDAIRKPERRWIRSRKCLL